MLLLKAELARIYRPSLRERIGSWLLGGKIDTCLVCDRKGFYHWLTYCCQWCGAERGGFKLEAPNKLGLRFPVMPEPPRVSE